MSLEGPTLSKGWANRQTVERASSVHRRSVESAEAAGRSWSLSPLQDQYAPQHASLPTFGHPRLAHLRVALGARGRLPSLRESNTTDRVARRNGPPPEANLALSGLGDTNAASSSLHSGHLLRVVAQGRRLVGRSRSGRTRLRLGGCPAIHGRCGGRFVRNQPVPRSAPSSLNERARKFVEPELAPRRVGPAAQPNRWSPLG
jgi:hypothetical protein